jgi:hypothetical protein
LKAPRWLTEISPRLILTIGWGLMVVYAFPGLMSFDSSMQLLEAREGFFTDAHPASMAWLWSIVDKFFAGGFGMLVMQTGMFIIGVYLLLKRAMPERRAAIATVVVVLFPPVLTPMAPIWKDSWMAALMLLGANGLMADRRWVRIAALGALMFATSIRYNAPAATLPLVLMLFVWSWERGIKRYALAAAAWVAIALGAFGINTLLTDQSMYIWHSSSALFDTVGTLVHVDGTIPDEELRELTAGTEILVDENIHAAMRRQYKPIDFETLISREGHLWEVPIHGKIPAPEPKRDAIARMFWDTVTSHPGAFLKHRWKVWRRVLGLYRGPMHVPVMMHRLQLHDLTAGIGHPPRGSALQHFWQEKVYWLARKSPLFRAWAWLVIALCLLPMARRYRDVLAMLLSGIGLEASLFLLAPTPDYRYSHWMVTCTVIAAVMLIARRARTAPPDVTSRRAV